MFRTKNNKYKNLSNNNNNNNSLKNKQKWPINFLTYQFTRDKTNNNEITKPFN